MLSAKPPSACATPFKGESFPSYVLSRASRAAGDGGSGAGAHRDEFPQVDTSRLSTPAVPRDSSSASSFDVGISPSSAVHSPVAARSRPTANPPQRLIAASLKPPVQQRRSFQRPSLADQLRSISQGAADVTAQLRAAHKLQPPSLLSSTRTDPMGAAAVLLQTTTVGMTVGKLECRFPCPVLFLRDHCAYLFQHPFAATEIQMVMFYRDMVGARVNVRDRRFHFRILRALEHFGDDYNPANPQHAITIALATAGEAHRLQEFLAEHRLWFGSSSSS
ncbi:hypothetical protein PybrP1_009250 [[Pythium] brassicae (nom. inval.)]|nr:hypothetical protein PybrP1_009250 [[Pythium] brassicae (nom. inval.)]